MSADSGGFVCNQYIGIGKRSAPKSRAMSGGIGADQHEAEWLRAYNWLEAGIFFAGSLSWYINLPGIYEIFEARSRRLRADHRQSLRE